MDEMEMNGKKEWNGRNGMEWNGMEWMKFYPSEVS